MNKKIEFPKKIKFLYENMIEDLKKQKKDEVAKHAVEKAYLVEVVKSFEDRSYPIFNQTFV